MVLSVNTTVTGVQTGLAMEVGFVTVSSSKALQLQLYSVKYHLR